MKEFYKRLLYTCIVLFTVLGAEKSFADGSKDMYPTTATGGRAKLRSSNGASASYPFPSLNAHYVYAKAGELITMASSEMGTGSASIRLTLPDGTTTPFTTSGNIANRTAELAGPRLPGQAGGNFYTPVYYTVPANGDGVYKVEFVAGGGVNNTQTNGRQDIAATGNWSSNGSNSCLVSAWDVSVYSAATAAADKIDGRVYTNILNLDINSVFSNVRNFYAVMYVLTKDGYVYKVNNNGSNGISFTFFVNNKGFVDGTGQPIYKSLNTTTNISSSVQDPRTADTESGITHKMFYTLPDQDLPLLASGAVDGGETWLKNPRLEPKVTNLNIVGVDGTIGQVSNKGGNVRFTANLAGRFNITITSTKAVGDPLYFTTRTISGSAVSGVNNVPWDGKDGSGNALPNGAVPAILAVKLQGAEVHFPYFDMEVNPNGLILQLLTADNSGVQSDVVYWNDTDIQLRDIPSDPINASQFIFPNGTSSSVNGHKWGSNGGPISDTFGDNKSMDTWTFILGAEEVKQIEVAVKKADLKIESVVADKAQAKLGDNIVYTVVVKNDGPSDVSGAPFAFNVPAGYEVTGVTYTTTCATEADGAISTDKQHYNSKLDLPNGCVITYSVTVKAISATPGTITVDATILRPNDVTDPDATNPSVGVPPTDPYYECTNNGLGTPCNNIKSNTTATLISPKLTLVKSVTNTGTAAGGVFQLGDVINYRFVVKNTGDVPLNTVNLTESLTGVTLAGPTGDTGNDAILSVNEEWTYTGTYTVTASNSNAGKVTNQATVTAIDPLNGTVTDLSGTTSTNDTPTETPILQIGKVSLLKTVSSITPVGGYKSGDVITYVFKVKNEGNVALSTVLLTDNIAGVAITGPTGDLGADNLLSVAEEWTYTGSYTITQIDVDAGKVSNVANVTSRDPGNNIVQDQSGTSTINDDPTETLITQSPAMELTKIGTYVDTNGDGKVNLGDQIRYTFKVENTGNVTITGITITDANVTVTGGPISLAPGVSDNTTFTALYNIKQTDLDKGGAYNIATATGKDPKGGTVTDDSENGNPGGPGVPAVDPACPTCTITGLPQSPAMKLTKIGTYVDTNGDGKVNLGDQIRYTFKVENTGNVTITGITITDANVTVTGGPISLAPGVSDNTTFTALYNIKQTDLDKGGAYNIATATGKDPKGGTVTDDSENGNPGGPGVPAVDPACPTCTITGLPQSPAMKLTKIGTYVDTNGDGKVNLGDQIRYTFKVENTGNVTITGITITDAKVTVTGGPISLAPGVSDNTTFTALYNIKQTDLDKGGAYNIATATGKDPKGGTVTDDSENGNPGGPGVPAVDPACPTCTITGLPQSPAMKLTKIGTYVDTNGDGKVNLGDQIRYTFKVENTGNVTITGITITDAKVTVTGGPISLAPGVSDNTTFTALYNIKQTDLDKGGAYNIATATGKDPKGGTVTDDSENGNPGGPGVPAVDPACPTCTITGLPQSPAMKLTKIGTYVDTNGDGKVNLGDQIRYTFKVENTGNVTITGITITDAKVTVTGGPISLAPGLSDNTTFTALYNIKQTDLDKGGAYNIATATGKDPKGGTVTDDSENGNPGGPGVPAVDPACPTCTITGLPQSPAMKLTKIGTYVDTNGDGKVNLGDQIRYTFKVENTGNVTITGITITDAKVTVSGGPISLAPGLSDNTTFTALYNIKQTDLDKGGAYNIATATGKDPKGGTVTDDSENGNPGGPGVPAVDPACPTCTITGLPQSPSITLAKVALTGTHQKVGDVINYKLTLTNTGNVTVNNLIISDDNADAGSISPATITSIAPNETVNITAKHTLTLADLDRGYVSNLAKADGKDPKGGNVHAESKDPAPVPGSPKDPACADCTITLVDQLPAITLVKKVTNTGTGEQGAFILNDRIEYTFTIKNTGNTTLNGIVLTDALLGKVINIPGTLAPGVSVNHIEYYTITAADVASGKVNNQAVVTAKGPKDQPVTDRSGTAGDNDNPTVTNIAKPPVATDDVASGQQNKPLKIEVQKNDVPGSSPLVPASIEISTPPKHGTLTLNPDGTVTYTPNPGYTGTDEFVYTVKDKNGQVSNPATVKITVVPSKPEATDDAAETQFNTEVQVPLLINDKADGAAIDKGSIEITEQPKNGTLKINPDGTVVYLPNSGFTGTDTFKYRVKDANGNWTNVATATIVIKGFFIPNVITPNGDGKNDNFVIVGAESNVDLTIFNRWGNEVYRNASYKNTWSGDGLNEGTYYYLIRISNAGKQEVYKGWVLIKR